MFISSLVAADDLEHDDTVPRDSEEDTLLKHKADKPNKSSVIATKREWLHWRQLTVIVLCMLYFS